MNKYYFEADKRQWEKPTEPKYVFCATAKTIVYADNDEEALEKADRKLTAEYLGSGALLSSIRMVRCEELPVDWSYGYGDDRKFGADADQAALIRDNQIR